MKSQLNNLLNFKEYSQLEIFNKPTKRTEIGGDIINEKKRVNRNKCKSCDKEIKIKKFDEYVKEDIKSLVKRGVDKIKNITGMNISREDAIKIINSHPAKKKYFDTLDDDKKEKLIDFLMKNPTVKYFRYDKDSMMYTDSEKINYV